MIEMICAWCKKKFREKEGGDGVSHGICPSCLKKQLKEVKKSKKGVNADALFY